MTITVDAIYEEALRLSESSRLALVERLIESVNPDPGLIEAQMEVVRERLDELGSGRAQATPGPEALRSVREAVLKHSQE